MMRSLPFSDWPEADRQGWVAACVPGERLRRGGRLAHLAAPTRDDLALRYGYFLGFLAAGRALDRGAAAGSHVTPHAVGAYVERARQDWSSVTLAQSVHKLRRVAETLAPERSFVWLAEIEKDLAFVAFPKARFDKLVLTTELVEAGLTFAREARAATHVRANWRAARFRSGLMVALLALCPIRVKNFAGLSLGSSVQRVGGSWCLSIARSQTKGRRADERTVPSMLTAWLDEYMTVFRPTLLLGGGGGVQLFQRQGRQPTTADQVPSEFWIAQNGKAMSVASVTCALEQTTLQAIGMRLSPHQFRVAAATTAAAHLSSNPHFASALLQHKNRRTTEAHYNRASSLTAATAFQDILRDFGH